MFVTVNFGNKQKALFNPNCQTDLLLENIIARCQCAKDIEIELSDEYGNLKNIQQLESKYASEVLKTERENLVLIQVTHKELSEKDSLQSLLNVNPMEKCNAVHTPLLRDEDIINQKFLARLYSKGSPSRPDSRKKQRKDKPRRSNESVVSSNDKNNESIMSQSFSSTKGLGSGKTRRKNGTPNKGRKK